MSDRIFAVVWLGVCALIIVQMWSLSVQFSYEPLGPKAFPMLLAALMSVCCIFLLVKPDGGAAWPKDSLLTKSALLIVALLGYAFFFATLGFPLSTALMTFVVSRLFGGRWIASAVSAVVIGVLCYLIFDRLLEVSLPLGLLRDLA